MSKFNYKAIAIVSPVSSFLSMSLAMLVVRLIALMMPTSNIAGFEAAYMAILLLVVLTPVFSSIISFASLYYLSKEARAFNAWTALAVSLAVDVVVGFPILVLSAIAA